MSDCEVDENPHAVVFAGPSGRLTLTFDPTTLRGGEREERWPTATVTFTAQGLHAVGKVTFFPHDLPPFVRDLTAAHARLVGQAKIESEDGEFSLTVEYANGGEVTVSGHLQPTLEDDSVLNYRIDTDQSYLTAALSALRGMRL